MSIYISRAKKKLYTICTDVILVILFTSLYLICFVIVLLGLVFEMPSLSFLSTRLWVGLGGLLVELPLLLLVIHGGLGLGTLTFT